MSDPEEQYPEEGSDEVPEVGEPLHEEEQPSIDPEPDKDAPKPDEGTEDSVIPEGEDDTQMILERHPKAGETDVKIEKVKP